jgi:hypothetical protein
MGNRAAWSAAGGVVASVSAANAAALAVAATPAHSGVAIWPAYLFGAVALCGLYLLVAPLLRWWPFRGPGSVAELLDERIREGRDARERIIRSPMESLEAAGELATWTLRTANLLHELHPAIADRFLLASADHNAFSGQALQIQTINAKLAVLTDARTGMAS